MALSVDVIPNRYSPPAIRTFLAGGVEGAFRTLTPSRPAHVYFEDHVRAHVFLCTLACHMEWNLRRQLAPALFEDDGRESADGTPVHGLPTLLADLGTLMLNEDSLPGSQDHAFPLLAKPSPSQSRVFELSNIDLTPNVAN